ncbi:MAG: zinc ribbon domain-containing protein [Kiritimatiellae bacterium]|nr:zinc ribbon domain-containing protein [Kiritimatiellia bacterium]
MPIYEYRCKCGNQFEKPSRISEMKREQKCAECGELAKLMVSVGVTFGEEVSWLHDGTLGAIQTEQEEKHNPITTRTQYKQVLKEKGFVERT